MFPIRYGLVLVAALAFVGCGDSDSEPGPLAPNPDQVGPVAFAGRVTSAVDGSPVAGLYVGLFTEEDGKRYRCCTLLPRWDWTDSTGHYELDPMTHYKGICDSGMYVFLQSWCHSHESFAGVCNSEWQDSERIPVNHCEPGNHVIDLQVWPK